MLKENDKMGFFWLAGFLFVIISWAISFWVGAKAIDNGQEINGYNIFMAISLGLLMAGCVNLSICSHKRIERLDGEESTSSVINLIVYVMVTIISIMLHFKSVVEYITVIMGKNNKFGIASVFSSSFFLVIAGLLGFCFRRKRNNIKTGITWCFMIIAFCAFVAGS